MGKDGLCSFQGFFPILFYFYFFACLRDTVMPTPENSDVTTFSQIKCLEISLHY